MAEIKRIEAKPNEELISEIKSLLEQAERGEIQALAYATLNSGCEFVTAWESGSCPVLSLLGATEMLKSDIMLNGMEW